MIFDIRDTIKKPMASQLIDASLNEVFNSMNRASLRYCLLRGLDELGEPVGDLEIDMLVDACQLELLRIILGRYGYLEIPAWGHAPHKFFMRFDADRDAWIKFDVVTDLRYGSPVRRYKIDLAPACFGGRLIAGNVCILSLPHEVVTLILHGLLDKPSLSQKHQDRLNDLLEVAAAHPSLMEEIDALLRLYFPPQMRVHGITSDKKPDWEQIAEERDQLRESLHSGNRIRSTWYHFSGLLQRKLRPLLLGFSFRGVSVALVAPDGAGKSTLADSLQNDRHLRARLVYMGSNIAASNVGLPTTAWLKKQVKALNGNRDSVRGITLRATNYLNRVAEQWYRILVAGYHIVLGRCVIFDRYTYDSYLAAEAKTLGRKIRRWLLRSTSPNPDLVIMLDAPGAVLFARKGEHSPEVLERQRQVFLSLEDKVQNLRIVDATQSAESVLKRTLETIWQLRVEKTTKKDNL